MTESHSVRACARCAGVGDGADVVSNNRVADSSSQARPLAARGLPQPARALAALPACLALATLLAACPAAVQAQDGRGPAADPAAVQLAYADDGSSDPAYAEPPAEVYADALISDMAGQVQLCTVAVGDTVTLSGDFRGGWGTVGLQWSCAEGADAAAMIRYEGPQTASRLSWEPVSEVTLPASLPDLNRALVPQGKSQTMVVAGQRTGASVWRLMAQDEVGDVRAIYWVVEVVPGGFETGASATKALANYPASGTSAQSQKAGFPQTGDERLHAAGIALAVVAAAGAVGVTASWLAERRRRNRGRPDA